MNATSPIRIICPVRACGAPLARGSGSLRCASGHQFDLARSGYANLLQPQDSRSRDPGDSREAVAARRRLVDRGIAAGLADAIGAMLAEAGIGTGTTILDVGCGEGFHLADACARLGAEGCGLDLSAAAIDLAARRHKRQVWIVANADRAIPLANASLDAVLSVTARVNRDEFARVLRPGGVALVAVAGAGDLAELRGAVLGDVVERDRALRAADELAPRFVVEARASWSEARELDRDALADLLVTTYRGQRRSQQGALDTVARMQVTSSRELVLLRKIDGAPLSTPQ